MIEYTLILFLYAGVLSKSDSVALTNVPGFKNQGACQQAGMAAVKQLTTGTFKDGKFICVRSE